MNTNFIRKSASDKGDSYVRRHVKAPSGSTMREATGLGRSLRGAFATRGASGDAAGRGAPSHRSSSRRALVSVTVAAAAVLTISSGPASAAECPNEAIRAEQGAPTLSLPDCMALEMVSPPQKGNQAAKYPIISEDGDRVAFRSLAALAETSALRSEGGDRYVASRGSGGWATAATAPPPVGLTHGWGGPPEAQSFTPDLSEWFQIASTESQYSQGAAQVFGAGFAGQFAPLSPLFAPTGGGGLENVEFIHLAGASRNHARLYFSPGEPNGVNSARYLSGDPRPSPFATSDSNTYIAQLDRSGQPSLALLARDLEGKVWGGNCGARLGGIGLLTKASDAPNGMRNQGAISADGSRVYMSARIAQPANVDCNTANKLRILQRLEGVQGPVIAPLFSSECTRVTPACKTGEAEGDDLYQGASANGALVYFTTNRQLANSDLDGTTAECSGTTAVVGCDLYLYDAIEPPGHRLIQVSAGESTASHPTVGSGAKVLNGTTAISADGSHVYFVAEAALTGENAEHKSPSTAAGARNLYLYERDEAHPAGRLAFVAALDPSGDAPANPDGSIGLWGTDGTWGNSAYPVPVLGSGSEGAEVAGDGHVLMFESKASLTPNDADGGHTDVYRYDATSGAIACLSCAAGGPDSAPNDVVPNEPASMGSDFAETGRWVADDGASVVFITAEALLPGDQDSEESFYLWRDGQLYLLPGTVFKGKLGATVSRGQVTLSADGTEIAYATYSPLLPIDGDANGDVYAARVDGGFPTPAQAVSCLGEACQEPFGAQPALTGTTSESQSGHNILPAAPCRKGHVRRHGRCVKSPRHHHRKIRHKKTHKRSAHANRRAAK